MRPRTASMTTRQSGRGWRKMLRARLRRAASRCCRATATTAAATRAAARGTRRRLPTRPTTVASVMQGSQQVLLRALCTSCARGVMLPRFCTASALDELEHLRWLPLCRGLSSLKTQTKHAGCLHAQPPHEAALFAQKTAGRASLLSVCLCTAGRGYGRRGRGRGREFTAGPGRFAGRDGRGRGGRAGGAGGRAWGPAGRGAPPPRPRPPTLLQKLLAKDIRRGRSHLLQSFRCGRQLIACSVLSSTAT